MPLEIRFLFRFELWRAAVYGLGMWRLICILFVVGISTEMEAQPAGANYDDAKVPAYLLQDPLVMADGTLVKTVRQWDKERRPEILKLVETHEYGRTPDPIKPKFE